jgi:hypothetical protein
MILILSLKSEDFEVLKSSVQKIDNIDTNLNLVKLQDYSLSGIALTRVALICDKHPEIIRKQGINFSLEASIPEARYCVACLVLGKFTPLNSRNNSGYCLEHRELDPKRKQSQHQRYKKRSSTNVHKKDSPK